MDMTEDEELELLELENKNAAAHKAAAGGGASPLVPGMTEEDAQLAGATKGELARRAVGAALDTPISAPGAPLDLGAAQAGLEGAANHAQRFYEDLGVPRLGKAVGMGGRFVAGSIPVRMKDALFVAAAGPALEAAAAVGRPVARVGGNLMAEVAGKMAGKSPEVVKAIFKKPGAMWAKAVEYFGEEHQKALVNAIDEGFAARGAQFKDLEGALSGFSAASKGKAPKVNLGPVLDDVVAAMGEQGHRLPRRISGTAPIKVGRLPADSAEYKAIVEKLDLFKKTKQLDFGEALNLRRQIDDMINYGVQGNQGLQPVTDSGQKVLKLMRRRLNTEVRNSVPSEVRSLWDKANFEYARAAQARAELKKSIIRAEPRLTENKLMQMIQEGRYDDEVVRRVERLNETSAKAFDDLRDQLAAAEFRQWVRSGGVVAGFGGMAAGGPTGALVGLGVTSPRVIGTAASAAGGINQVAEQVARQIGARPNAAALGIQGLRGVPQEPVTR